MIYNLLRIEGAHCYSHAWIISIELLPTKYKLLPVLQVNGMQAGVTFTLVAQNGTLRLTVVECGTYIDDLEIELQGGASWLYQL